MYRKVLVLLVMIITVIYIGYISHEHTEEVSVKQPSSAFTPVTETYSGSLENDVEDTLDFISFSSEHVLDIQAVLQMPEYPTGCELISLTMALSYITQEQVDTDILIDDYLTMSPNDFVNSFMGDPRSESGGGCYPPFIAKCANEYLTDIHLHLQAEDVSGITRQEIFDYIDSGFPVIIWSTMYMEAPQMQNQIIETKDKTYQWYISEHCVLIKGYNTERNVFVINDPLIGETEQDIDKFMEISDYIGNLAVVIK